MADDEDIEEDDMYDEDFDEEYDEGMSIVDKLLDDNNDDVIELSTEDGEKQSFEQVAVVMHEGEPYAILRPMKMKENQVVVFRLDPEDEDAMDLIIDEKLAGEVLKVYQNEKE